MAKNKIRRSLVSIIDPYPSKSEVDQLWEYFESRCAYCGISINRGSRTGHLDHLIPSSEGGSNSIYNHALSCARWVIPRKLTAVKSRIFS
ncbi:HNH endonuclease [Marinomonas atlantica]|uniref:HNH endonuclease n=1 Tax=Marinomonas atlantica TaxID=1806668 RepID=UPI0038B3FB40